MTADLSEERLLRSGIPKRFWRQDPPEYSFSPVRGKGVLLLGPPGAGKTHFACTLAQKYMAQAPGLRVRYRTMANIIGDQRRVMTYLRGKDDVLQEGLDLQRSLDELLEVGLLIVDDVAKEHATDWTTSQFDSLLRTRFDLGRRTMATTNLPTKDWASRYSEAMASFIHEAFDILPLLHKDRRREERPR